MSTPIFSGKNGYTNVYRHGAAAEGDLAVGLHLAGKRMQRNACRTAAHLHFSVLRKFRRVVDIKPEVPSSALDLGMVAPEPVSFIAKSPVQHG